MYGYTTITFQVSVSQSSALQFFEYVFTTPNNFQCLNYIQGDKNTLIIFSLGSVLHGNVDSYASDFLYKLLETFAPKGGIILYVFNIVNFYYYIKV